MNFSVFGTIYIRYIMYPIKVLLLFLFRLIHFQPRENLSPYISQIVPRSGPADQIITIYGRFFTDRYGSEVATASNGKTQKIKR